MTFAPDFSLVRMEAVAPTREPASARYRKLIFGPECVHCDGFCDNKCSISACCLCIVRGSMQDPVGEKSIYIACDRCYDRAPEELLPHLMKCPPPPEDDDANAPLRDEVEPDADTGPLSNRRLWSYTLGPGE